MTPVFLVTLAPEADLAIALGIGLLIGLERERRQARRPSGGPAGIRTFALVALVGGLAAQVGSEALLAVSGGFVALIAVAAYVRSREEDTGITTEVALLTTFLLGALAQDEPGIAAAAGVAVAALLTLRERIHRLVRDAMSEEELHDLLLFAAAALVVLPLLPDRDVGPYEAINPFSVWRLVVLVMAIGGTGYVSLRLLGPRLGLPVAGLAGGFVSSAATIGSMGGLAHRNPGLRNAAAAGAVLSTLATFVQMAVVLAATSDATLREMALPLVLGGGVALVAGGLAALRVRHTSEDATEHPGGRAFDLRDALLFAATVSTVLVVAAALNDWAGERGVLISTALAGFADTHAAAVSTASLVASGNLEAGSAVVPILAGMTTNTITKSIAAYITGKRPFAVPVWVGLAAVIGAAWAGAILGRGW